MSRTRQLVDLRADVRWQADQLGTTALSRHDNTALNRIINQSIQRFREWVSEQGSAMYLTADTSTLTTGATSPYTWREVSFPATAVRILHVEITVDSRIQGLDQVAFDERNDYQDNDGPTNGVPVAFFTYGSKIGILPPPDSAYSRTIWFLPQFTDLSADSDTFDGVAGWEEWLVWDCLLKLVVRDKYPQQYQVALAERDRLQSEILQSIRQNSPTATRRRDVRSLRDNRFDRRWGYR